MKNFEVIDIFRFDFSDRVRSKKILQKLFNKYGFSLFKIDLTNDYNNVWAVVNKNDNSIINVSYKSSYVLFYKENDIIHVAFDYKIKFDTSKNYYMSNNFIIRG